MFQLSVKLPCGEWYMCRVWPAQLQGVKCVKYVRFCKPQICWNLRFLNIFFLTITFGEGEEKIMFWLNTPSWKSSHRLLKNTWLSLLHNWKMSWWSLKLPDPNIPPIVLKTATAWPPFCEGVMLPPSPPTSWWEDAAQVDLNFIRTTLSWYKLLKLSRYMWNVQLLRVRPLQKI